MMHDPRRRVIVLASAALLTAAVALAALVFGFGARLDAPTIALAAAAAALVHALGQAYAMVWALSRPDRVAQVGQAAGSFSQAELRDEKRRLLRAIKELEFDHGMGKLSAGDFEAVIATYRLRAIEVMRALEGGTTLHPELTRLLAERAAKTEGASAEPVDSAPGPLAEAAPMCGACGRSNDADAQFCKHCGAAMKKSEPVLASAQAGELGGAT